MKVREAITVAVKYGVRCTIRYLQSMIASIIPESFSNLIFEVWEFTLYAW